MSDYPVSEVSVFIADHHAHSLFLLDMSISSRRDMVPVPPSPSMTAGTEPSPRRMRQSWCVAFRVGRVEGPWRPGRCPPGLSTVQCEDSLQDSVAYSMRNVGVWAHALSRDPTPIDAFRHLDVPVLYMAGEHSPIPGKGVARLLTSALPKVEYVELEGLGHMAPLTQPARVNPLIEEFLVRHLE